MELQFIRGITTYGLSEGRVDCIFLSGGWLIAIDREKIELHESLEAFHAGQDVPSIQWEAP